MRTKTLLLTAALSAAGIATSMAQVFSVNAVGYVNTPVVPGFNLVSNPLSAPSNAIKDLFKDVPLGTFIYKFVNGNFVATSRDEFSGEFDPADVALLTVLPGEGVFVQPPSAATITFVGEVPQGALKTPLKAGLQIIASQVPQAGTVSTVLGYPSEPGEFLYQFNPTSQQYASFTQDEFGGGWSPSEPSLKVGEAVFVQRLTAGSWDRTFSVNQ